MPHAYRFRYYRPGLVQRAHRHELPHMSVIICGSVTEENNGEERRVGGGVIACRHPGFTHQIRIGNSGALILSAPLCDPENQFCRQANSGSWAVAPSALVQAALQHAAAGNHESVEDTISDLVGGLDIGARGAAPAWMMRARDELIEESTSITELAKRAGVHRVHFSRLFHAAFGDPPSLYRRRMRALRVAAAASQGQSGADAAYSCGFSDQSHMCRALREIMDLSFTELRGIGAEVTSVQE